MDFDVSAYPDNEPLVSVTAACVVAASNRYQIAPGIILSVLGVEGGKVGHVSRNKNGTVDIGPMQINSIHLPDLAKYGISYSKLKNDGCLNVHIGAWMLRRESVAAGNHWDGIGHYHSRTENRKKIYQSAVWQKTLKLPEQWKNFDCRIYNACNLSYGN